MESTTVTVWRRWRVLPSDLPWQGQLVELQVQVPRLRCNHASCPQVIFAERLPAVMLPRARRTVRPREALTSLGL
jgi:hypothetical protein